MNLLSDCHGKSLADGLHWLNEPPEWHACGGGLTVAPEPGSDLFRPYHGKPRDDGCLLHLNITGDFTAVAQAKTELIGFGDAAGLAVRAGDTKWAKLCIERSPAGETSIVSVVTDPWSDDSNGEILHSPGCYLRLTRKGNVIGMHYSLDGSRWRFVRTFGMEMPPVVMIGIEAQAPSGGGCKVRFQSFTVSPTPVADFRSGE